MLTFCIGLTHATGAAQGRVVRYDLKPGISVGEAVVLELTLTNGGQGTVDVNLGASNVEYLVFDITLPGGTRTTVRPLLGDGFQTGGRYRLGPADREVVVVTVSDLANFSKPGPYTVAVTFSGGVYRQGTQESVQRQAKWQFTLNTRDSIAIQRRCEELLSIIQKGGPDSSNAVTVLAAMRLSRGAVPVEVCGVTWSGHRRDRGAAQDRRTGGQIGPADVVAEQDLSDGLAGEVRARADEVIRPFS